MAESRRRAVVLEPDPMVRARTVKILAGIGIDAQCPAGLDGRLDEARADVDLVLVSWTVPGIRANGALSALRSAHKPGNGAQLIVIGAEPNADERARAFDAGADDWLAQAELEAALPKSIDALHRFELRFWGVRGTLPIPGARTLRYGGNTSCLSVTIGRDRRLVLDAGTGMKALSDDLMREQSGRFDGAMLITHPHLDHLNSLPFFEPLYVPGNRVRLYGPAQGTRSLRDLISEQMDGTFFPITVEEFKAEVSYHDLVEGNHTIDGIAVHAKRLRHPGHCLGYRMQHGGRSLAYVTDNELGPSGPATDAYTAELAAFLSGADVLIHDTTYFDEEYPSHANWGHSSVGQVAALAHRAGVGHYYLFHHDPDHGDREIEIKHSIARALLTDWGSTTQCHIAAEGLRVSLDAF